jgi:two-component system phosphate regulon response regulator PhoB
MGHVLVIEDDADTADALQRLFRRRGHDANVLSGGTRALQWLDSNPPAPDVVVLDWMMPDMDGGQVLRLLKSHPDYRDLKVIVFSGAFDHDRMHQARQLGAADYLVKGTVSWSTVLDKVETLIRGGQAA